MKVSEFLEKIDQLKFRKLGGLDAQFKLAPELRLRYNKEKIKALNPKIAAVLALFFPDNENNINLLLTKRASYKGIHSAQVSFPGGKFETFDNNLKDTALRETFEEVGVESNSIEVLRELTDVYIPPSNFLATPFIGFSNSQLVFNFNYEVENLLFISIDQILDDNNISEVKMTTSYMENMNVPCFKINETIIWGATAMMLSEIKELLK